MGVLLRNGIKYGGDSEYTVNKVKAVLAKVQFYSEQSLSYCHLNQIILGLESDVFTTAKRYYETMSAEGERMWSEQVLTMLVAQNLLSEDQKSEIMQ